MPSRKRKAGYAFSVAGLEVRLRPFRWTMTTHSPDDPPSVDSSVVGVTIDLDGLKRGYLSSWSISVNLQRRRY